MKRHSCFLWIAVGCLLALSACSGSAPDFEKPLAEIKPDEANPYLWDTEGRFVHLHGINLGGNAKVPILNTKEAPGFSYGAFDYRRCDIAAQPPTYCPYASCDADQDAKDGTCRCKEACKTREGIEATDPQAFKHPARPYPLAEGDHWLGQLQALGFNSVRLIFMWESLFPEKKGKLDQRMVNYIDEVTAQAQDHNMYMVYSMHENLFSRHLYVRYNNFPLCQTCCVYDENDHPIRPDGTVLSDITCQEGSQPSCLKDSECQRLSANSFCVGASPYATPPVKGTCSLDPMSKKGCCQPGDIMNQIWSLVPSTPTEDLMKREPNETGRSPYLNGFNDRTSGDGAPLWATKICLPEKNFDSPYWGAFKLTGTLQKCSSSDSSDGDQDAESEGNGCSQSEFYYDLTGAIGYLKGQAAAGKPVVDEATIAQIESTYRALENYLPPTPGFEMEDTNDFMPMPFWAINAAVSLSSSRCYAAFFAGDKVWPKARVFESYDPSDKAAGIDTRTFWDPESAEAQAYLAAEKAKGRTVDTTKNLKTAMQESYFDAWKAIGHLGKKYTHIAGYDLINEPSMVFVIFSAVALSFELGVSDKIATTLEGLITQDKTYKVCDDATPPNCESITQKEPIKIGTQSVGSMIYNILVLLDLFPKDKSDATKARWGMLGVDLGAALNLAAGPVDKDYLQPLYEYLGKAVLAEYCPTNADGTSVTCIRDSRPIIWVESAGAINTLINSFENSSSTGGEWKQYMTRPVYPKMYGTIPLVFSPHYYTDMHPTIGFNAPSRTFTKDVYTNLDWTTALASTAGASVSQFNNAPVVYGEFGNFWNFQSQEFVNDCLKQGCLCTSGSCSKEECKDRPKSKLCRPGYQQSEYPAYKGTDGLPSKESDIYDGAMPLGDAAVCMARELCQSVADASALDADVYNKGTNAEVVKYEPQSYHLSHHMLDNHYEAFEKLLMSNMQWVFTAGTDCVADGERCIPSSTACRVTAKTRSMCAVSDRCCSPLFGACTIKDDIEGTEISGTNPDGSACRFVRDPQYGDLWSHEDFSMVDQWGRPRGWVAYQRPYARALSGKPIATHFYGPLHDFDPNPGQVTPVREFYLEMGAKGSDAPTIVYVPNAQYPEGFYVWLSDGWAGWDAANQLLYWHLTNDDPKAKHTITIRPPLAGDDLSAWSYFVAKDGKVLAR